MTSIKPQGNRLVIKPKKATSSIGGILLPESAQQKPKEGTVVAVGPGELLEDGKRRPLSVCVGDEILYASYSAHEITQGSEEFLILPESDVLGVFSPSSSTCCKSCK